MSGQKSPMRTIGQDTIDIRQDVWDFPSLKARHFTPGRRRLDFETLVPKQTIGHIRRDTLASLKTLAADALDDGHAARTVIADFHAVGRFLHRCADTGITDVDGVQLDDMIRYADWWQTTQRRSSEPTTGPLNRLWAVLSDWNSGAIKRRLPNGPMDDAKQLRAPFDGFGPVKAKAYDLPIAARLYIGAKTFADQHGQAIIDLVAKRARTNKPWRQWERDAQLPGVDPCIDPVVTLLASCAIQIHSLSVLRISEMLSLEVGCCRLKQTNHGPVAILGGRAFKDVDNIEGEPAPWHAHAAVCGAIDMLERLSQPLRDARTGHNEIGPFLFVNVLNKPPLAPKRVSPWNLGLAMRRFNQRFVGIGETISAQRFRTSMIARIGAEPNGLLVGQREAKHVNMATTERYANEANLPAVEAILAAIANRKNGA